MVNLPEALAQKKTRLQRLQAETEQVKGEIEILSKASAILDQQNSNSHPLSASHAASSAMAAPAPEPAADIRKQFP